MTIQIGVDGAHRLHALSRRLKKAGNGELKKRLRKSIREAAAPVLADVRAAALAIPAAAPHGTLRRDIAAATRLENRARTGVRIVVKTSRLGDKAAMPRLFERRTFRRRVFGTDEWVTQAGHPWFATTLARKAPAMRAAIEAEVDAIARELER